MDWFRHYHGLCTDPKLHRVSRAAGVNRAVVIAAWCAILEEASSANERGSVANLDAASLSFMIDVKPHVAGRVLDAIKAAGMLDESGCVVAWKRRQRDSDDASVRKRIQREREGAVKLLSGNDTDGGSHVTKPLQNRTEQKIESDTSTESNEQTVESHTPQPVPADAGPASPSIDAKTAFWREAKAAIGGKNPGSLLGRWCRDFGEGEVFSAHCAARRDNPADYRSWMERRLRGPSQARASPINGNPLARTGRGVSIVAAMAMIPDQELEHVQEHQSIIGSPAILDAPRRSGI